MFTHFEDMSLLFHVGPRSVSAYVAYLSFSIMHVQKVYMLMNWPLIYMYGLELVQDNKLQRISCRCLITSYRFSEKIYMHMHVKLCMRTIMFMNVMTTKEKQRKCGGPSST